MSDQHDCDGCPLVDRRSFLRNTALAAVALAGIPALARALETHTAALIPVSARNVRGPLRSYAIPAADGVQIDHDAGLIVVRWEKSVYAFDLACPHQNTALRWDDRDKHFRCPKHHSEYEPTGVFVRGRATRGMDRFAVSQDAGGQLVIDSSKTFEQDHDPSGWEAAVVHL